jgi:uncharacterized membrane protein
MKKPDVSVKRHILKSFTWRAIASLTSFCIAWAVTGNVKAGLTVGVADVIIKLVLYYLHERVWYRSKFGIKKECELEEAS